MLAAQYVGDQAFSVADQERSSLARARSRSRRFHRHLRHGSAHLPRRHGRMGTPRSIGHEMSGRIPRRRRASTGWPSASRDRDAAALGRTCPACRAGHTTSARPRLHRHRLPRCDAGAGTCRPTFSSQLPATVRWTTRPWSSPPPSRSTTCAGPSEGRRAGPRGRRRSGRPADRDRGPARGADVAGGARRPPRAQSPSSSGIRTLDPGRDVSAWVEDGPTAPAPTSPSRCRGGGRGGRGGERARRGASSWWHPQPPREVDLFRSSGASSTLVGARLYERADFETAVSSSPTARSGRALI